MHPPPLCPLTDDERADAADPASLHASFPPRLRARLERWVRCGRETRPPDGNRIGAMAELVREWATLNRQAAPIPSGKGRKHG